MNVPLEQNKKLTVIYRLEPGCLGPQGPDHINDFCSFAQEKVQSVHSDMIIWKILPRNDKSLPEIEYKLNNKKLSREKAGRFLIIFDREIEVFEESFHEKIAELIETYFEQK